MTTLFHVRPKTPNIGNDLIALGMESLLLQAFGQELNLVSIPAISQDSRIKGSGLSARNVHEINQVADGLVIGAGNLFENGGLHCDLGALSSLRVPTMLLSVSMGRIYDRVGSLVARTDSLAREKIEALCRLADPAMVRDQATAAYLERLGAQDICVVGCPSLFLDRVRLPEPEPLVQGSVLISIRHPDLMSIPYQLKGRVRQTLRGTIDMLRSRGHERIHLLCHDYQDLSFAREYPDVRALYTEDTSRFLGWLRDCQLNITFRLHGFLSCLVLGTPSIHLSYDERAHSMIHAVGLSDWEVNFVLSQDVLDELRQRCDSLADLEKLQRQQRPRWDSLRTAMTDGAAVFARRVRAYQKGLAF